jgi:hypothetical protein
MPGLPPTRRASGARFEVSARIELRVGDRTIPGWALNRSRGGLRAVIEEQIELGASVVVVIGGEPPRPGRVVWMQDEMDGAIVGLSYQEAPAEPGPPAGG